jgi:hypothetical protein
MTGSYMLKTPRTKRELIKLLQDASEFNVLAVSRGKKKDVAEAVSKVLSTRDLAVIVLELR